MATIPAPRNLNDLLVAQADVLSLGERILPAGAIFSQGLSALARQLPSIPLPTAAGGGGFPLPGGAFPFPGTDTGRRAVVGPLAFEEVLPSQAPGIEAASPSFFGRTGLG